eukprot:7741107-Pyramimonas_sp.AAC.1
MLKCLRRNVKGTFCKVSSGYTGKTACSAFIRALTCYVVGHRSIQVRATTRKTTSKDKAQLLGLLLSRRVSQHTHISVHTHTKGKTLWRNVLTQVEGTRMRVVIGYDSPVRCTTKHSFQRSGLRSHISPPTHQIRWSIGARYGFSAVAQTSPGRQFRGEGGRVLSTGACKLADTIQTQAIDISLTSKRAARTSSSSAAILSSSRGLCRVWRDGARGMEPKLDVDNGLATSPHVNEENICVPVQSSVN